MKRFIEKCAILIALSIELVGPVCFLLYFYVLFFTDYYVIALIYLAYFAYDQKTCDRDGRKIEWIRNLPLWKHASNYFPATLVKTADLDPRKNYICGYHPHGCYVLGALLKFGFESADFRKNFPGMTCHLLVASQCTWFPVQREIGLSLDCRTVSKESIRWQLNKKEKGKMLILPIGGAVEGLDANPGTAKLTLKTRKGFVRIAIEEGASLVPIFAFGENDIFVQRRCEVGSVLRWVRDTFRNVTRLAMPLPRNLIPFRVPIDVIVGEPIEVVSNANPTVEEVEYYHKLYIDNLVELFDRYKINYDIYKNVTMEIV